MRYLLMLLLCLSANTINAQGRSVLFEINPNNGSRPSYLIGYCYLSCMKEFHFSERMKEKIHDADFVYFQNKINDPDYIPKIQEHCVIPDGKQLKDLYSEEDYKLIGNFLKDTVGVNINEMNHNMPPYILADAIFSKLKGCEPQSVQTGLFQYSLDNDKRIEALEDVGEVFYQLNKIDLESRSRFLLTLVNNYDELQKLLVQHGDSKEQLCGFTYYFNEQQRKYLIDEPNQKWVEKLQENLNSKNCFVCVVPNFHLTGESGIVKKLENKGYSVKVIEDKSF